MDAALDRLGMRTHKRLWATPGAMASVLDPKTKTSRALRYIDQKLVDLVDGKLPDGKKKLMVFMPPQEGKSERVSHRFPLWLLHQNPTLRISMVSYNDELARRWGAAIKNDLLTHNGTDGTVDVGLRLSPDEQAAGRWNVERYGGGLYCVGIRGALTGKAVDVLIIDDPVKDLETAQSKSNRDAAWSFWTSVATPRMSPDTIVVLIQTRWHEDDLAGRILASEGDEWEVVSIPAIADQPNDPLKRSIGERLQSVRGDRDWDRIRRNVGEYVWAALYQQRPSPLKGGLFKRTRFKYWQPLPVHFASYGPCGGRRLQLDNRVFNLDDCWRFITVDLAASVSTSADWTVAAAWAVTNDADLLLLDLVRDRVLESGHWDLVNPLRLKYAVDIVFVESRMFGTTMVRDAVTNGVPIVELVADTDKITRSIPATARVDAGKLWFPNAADWLPLYESELASFPNGSFDDQVDITSYAARAVAAHWVAAYEQPNGDRALDAADSAMLASTGQRSLQLVRGEM